MAEGETPNDGDGVEALGATMRTAFDGMASNIVTAIRESNTATLDAIRELVRPATPPAPAPEQEPDRDARLLPGGGRGVDPSDRMRDPWTAEGYTRADFEIAMLLQGGARSMRNPVEVEYSDQFLAAARFHIHEDPKTPRIRVMNANGVTRAMDAQETGYGLELIGAQYITEMWEAARNLDSLVADIRSIPMAAPTVYVPISGELPEMLFVSENTAADSTAYTSSKTPSNRVPMTAKKFTIQQIWSGELGEDSIVPFVPFLREMLNISAAQHLGSAYYNGDTTNAGTGNINSDDADPTDTKHYLAWDGIRHDWLVTTTANGINMAAALDVAKINVARGKLNGADDDIDAAVKSINWGRNPRELRLTMDWDTYMAMLDADKVTTVDKYGAAATVLTGELGNYAGIPIIAPSYASKTEADGKASGTEASNTKGQITVFNPRAYLAGVRREVQFFMDRIQGRDQFLIEIYTRRAFTRFGTNGAAGIYNITL